MPCFVTNVLVDGHVDGIFKLDCVKGVQKMDNGPLYELKYVTSLDTGKLVDYANIGDWLCLTDTGEWYLIEGERHKSLN